MSTQNLEKSFKTKDVFAMAFGTMIGWGWIMLSGQWAASAGMLGAILAYVVGALLCIFVGLIYSELTPAIPFTGGGVVFAYKSMGYWPSVFAGLATALAYLGVAACFLLLTLPFGDERCRLTKGRKIFLKKFLTAGFASGQSACLLIKRSPGIPAPAASLLP